MPYRRLPKTDQARIRALRAAVESSVDNGVFTNVLSHNTYYRAKNMLENLSREVGVYKRCVQEQSSKRGNEAYEAALKKARMYVSHFIQVLSMSIMRGEIARSKRPYYGLPENEDTVPNLFSESAVLEWGLKIMEGERRRQAEGGVPIYNPTMGRVSLLLSFAKIKIQSNIINWCGVSCFAVFLMHVSPSTLWHFRDLFVQLHEQYSVAQFWLATFIILSSIFVLSYY